MDLITTLGRLLHDGGLRDEFAARPEIVLERLNVRAADRPALLAVSTADLEFQARVLVGKRFNMIQPLIPRTLANLGVGARPAFLAFARKNSLDAHVRPAQDAAEFCKYWACSGNANQICGAEKNRLNFALSGKSFGVHFIRKSQLRNRSRNAFQIFVRLRAGNWHESILYFGL